MSKAELLMQYHQYLVQSLQQHIQETSRRHEDLYVANELDQLNELKELNNISTTSLKKIKELHFETEMLRGYATDTDSGDELTVDQKALLQETEKEEKLKIQFDQSQALVKSQPKSNGNTQIDETNKVLKEYHAYATKRLFDNINGHAKSSLSISCFSFSRHPIWDPHGRLSLGSRISSPFIRAYGKTNARIDRIRLVKIMNVSEITQDHLAVIKEIDTRIKAAEHASWQPPKDTTPNLSILFHKC